VGATLVMLSGGHRPQGDDRSRNIPIVLYYLGG
jgi:hypothetical protein